MKNERKAHKSKLKVGLNAGPATLCTFTCSFKYPVMSRLMQENNFFIFFFPPPPPQKRNNKQDEMHNRLRTDGLSNGGIWGICMKF